MSQEGHRTHPFSWEVKGQPHTKTMDLGFGVGPIGPRIAAAAEGQNCPFQSSQTAEKGEGGEAQCRESRVSHSLGISRSKCLFKSSVPSRGGRGQISQHFKSSFVSSSMMRVTIPWGRCIT